MLLGRDPAAEREVWRQTLAQVEADVHAGGWQAGVHAGVVGRLSSECVWGAVVWGPWRPGLATHKCVCVCARVMPKRNILG